MICDELTSRGYTLRHMTADACDFNVPQHRTRIYIVAFKSEKAANLFVFPQNEFSTRQIFDVIDKSTKAHDGYYLMRDTKEYEQLSRAMTDENQIYRFSDYGIQSSRNGISRKRIEFVFHEPGREEGVEGGAGDDCRIHR